MKLWFCAFLLLNADAGYGGEILPKSSAIIHGNEIPRLTKYSQSEEEERDRIEEETNAILERRHRGRGKFSCLSCQPPDCDHVKYCHNAVRCYTAHVRDDDGTEHKSKGCTKNRQQTMFHCATKSYDGDAVHAKQNRSAQYSFDCCIGNKCNENATFPVLPPVPVIEKSDVPDQAKKSSWSNVWVFVIPFSAVFILAIVISLALYLNYKKKIHKMNRHPDFGADHELDGLRAHPVGDSTLREYQRGDGVDNSYDDTSGSGSGMPKLTRRTFAKDIVFEHKIGGGRYGEVFRGTWNGSDVAVKAFNTREEESFKREKDIYGQILLRHDNILVYYGHDCTSVNSTTQQWIVTQYHPLGSLYDYLNRPEVQSLSCETAFKLIFTALKGLVHLHSEVRATQEKPSIAHRDIKSKNILIRGTSESELSCVLADFGLAVTDNELPYLTFTENTNTRVGTKRYMSPEVLDLSILDKKSREMEAFRKSDMYSFALVMWEVFRKTRVFQNDPNSAEDFALPYHMDVGPDPSFEEMRKVVCVAQRRPDMLDKWFQNEFIADACTLMKTCWHQNPSVRHTSQRLMKSLYKISAKIEEKVPIVRVQT